MAGKDPERPGGQTGDGASHRVRRHGDTTLPTRPVQAERQSTDRGSPPGSVDGFAPPDCAGAPGGSGATLPSWLIGSASLYVTRTTRRSYGLTPSAIPKCSAPL